MLETMMSHVALFNRCALASSLWCLYANAANELFRIFEWVRSCILLKHSRANQREMNSFASVSPFNNYVNTMNVNAYAKMPESSAFPNVLLGNFWVLISSVFVLKSQLFGNAMSYFWMWFSVHYSVAGIFAIKLLEYSFRISPIDAQYFQMNNHAGRVPFAKKGILKSN